MLNHLLSTLSFWQSSALLSVFAFFSTFVTIPLTIKLAKKIKLLDYPQRDHPAILHQKPIPRGGGIPLFIGFLITALLFLPLTPPLIALLLGGFINVAVGTIDDKVDLSPWLRLLVTLPLAALPLLFAGIHITISNPLGPNILTFQWWPLNISLLATTIYLPEAALIILWIVWVCNMINWTKGASQLPGMAAVAFFTLGGVALKYQAGNPLQLTTAQLSFIFAAISLALLPFNFPPEKIFPGFGGSTFIGFNLAALSILSGGKLAAAILVLGVPVADMVISLWRRFRKRKNPLKGDRAHLYHLLLEAGLTKRQVIIAYWLITLLLGVFALNLERGEKLFAIAFVFTITTGAFFVARRLIAKSQKVVEQED